MLGDILKKYMNVFIIILYVYILYSYDFKENMPLLLLVTGIFIYIIYNNKNNVFSDIIEGNTDGDAQENAGQLQEGASCDPVATEPGEMCVSGTTCDQTSNVCVSAPASDTTDTVDTVDTADTADNEDSTDTAGNSDGQIQSFSIYNDMSILDLQNRIEDVQNDLNSLRVGGRLDGDNPQIQELVNLYLRMDPSFNLDVPNYLETGQITSSNGIRTPEIKLNINLGDIKIPKNVIEESNKNEIPKLKKRINSLEERIKELDDEEHVNVMKEKIMDIEIEHDKWNQKGIEESEGGEVQNNTLKTRKVKSYTSYKTTTPMGMYDNLCIDHLKKENVYGLADEGDVNTFLGTTLPLKIKKADNSDLTGPSVDGYDESPKRLNMFETNHTSISCCEDSPYFSSNGCVCITSDQEDYLTNRGGNHLD
jgi:hypothetical protein